MASMPGDENQEKVFNDTDADVFTFVPFFSHVSSAIIASFLLLTLAVLFPWNGGPVTHSLAFFFGLAVLGSIYALSHGYLQILKHGLKVWGVFVWCMAVFVSIALSVDIIIFGSTLINSTIVFFGSDILMSSVIFASLVIFQVLYFLIEALIVSLANRPGKNSVMNWYLAIYLFILSMNSAAVILGLLVIGYFHKFW